jgi:hypothetical protein
MAHITTYYTVVLDVCIWNFVLERPVLTVEVNGLCSLLCYTR